MTDETTQTTAAAAESTEHTRPPDDRSRRRRRAGLATGAVVAAVVVGVGLWLTQPWLLFVDVVAEESLPLAVADAPPDGAAPDEPADAGEDAPDGATDDPGRAAGAAGETAGAGDETAGAADRATGTDGDATSTDDTAGNDTRGAPDPAGDTATGPVALARGEFISRDHPTSGTVAIVQLEDGSRVLTIEGLDTDNGPDLFVYLDDDAADAAEGAFDDGISLGRLRANQGDLVYEIPDDLDLSGVTSVGIWCDRFSSLFGAADLVATTTNG